ncbi:MAG: DsbC family protein [Nitrospirota bacterium]
MRKFVLIVLISLLAVIPFFVHAALSVERCDHDCMKCHQLSNNGAVNLLKDAVAGVKVLEIKPGPVKGLWEIAAEANGRKALYYVDFSKKFIVVGNVFDLKTKTNLTQERFLALNKVDVSLIPLDDAIVIGDKQAKKRIIVFTDPDCPYCARLHAETKKVIEKRKDIAFYVKMFPLKMHPGAYEKSKAIVCEKSLALLDDAFEKKKVPKPKCETSVVDDNIKLAEKIGISGTPALIMPNGTLIPGYKDADSLISLVDKMS